jgi:hypothetical protein
VLLTEKHRSIFMKSKAFPYLLSGIVITFIVITILTNLGSNLWLTITESEYKIPVESNMLTFNPLLLNPGSGDWWIYGEDRVNYYYHQGDDNNPYVILNKSKAIDCEKFNPLEIDTWCK